MKKRASNPFTLWSKEKDRSATRAPRGFVECSIDLAIDFFGNKCWIEPKGYNKPL